jgi:hypothetical protein
MDHHRCIRQRGRRMVELPASVSAKILLFNEMLLQQVRPSELAKRLDIPRQHVNRLLDPRRATKIDGIAAALKVLGKTLEIRAVEDDALLHPQAHTQHSPRARAEPRAESAMRRRHPAVSSVRAAVQVRRDPRGPEVKLSADRRELRLDITGATVGMVQ